MFEDLKGEKFGVILADPEWQFALYSDKGNGKSPQQHYDCSPLDLIKQRPVQSIALDNSVLVLWATFPMLDFARETMVAWGFTYKTGGAWMKTTKEGQKSFGTGFIVRSAAELFLIGTRGKPKIKSKSVRNLITGGYDPERDTEIEYGDIGVALTSKRRQHSQKPKEVHELIEELWDGPYLEMHAREAKRPGWTFWGDELDKF